MCICIHSNYKERAHFARSLLAPVCKHIAYFIHINLPYIASSVDMTGFISGFRSRGANAKYQLQLQN